MTSITSLGIGSGLDINQLVDDMVAAEREPAEARLDLRQAEYDAELSAYGSLKSALSGLDESLGKLTDSSKLLTYSATSSNEDFFTASASSSAATGNYDIEVISTAEAHKLKSDGFAGSDSVVGTGDLTFASGDDSFSVTIDSSNNTLAGIRDAINDAEGNDSVKASIIQVDDGLGGTVSKLVLTAEETGTANEIAVGGSLAGALNMQELSAAKDAQIRVDGELATRSTNTLDDVIEGVEINLVAGSEGTTETLTVGQDNSAVSKEIDNFIANYNNLIATIQELSKYNPDTGEAGILLGDSTLRGLQTQLRQGLSNPVDGAGSYSTLVDIGITTNRDGTLSLDKDKLDAALKEDADSVADLFASEDGIAVRLDNSLDDYLEDDGILDSRTEGIESSLVDLERQREDLDRRMKSLEDRYLAQFIAMDQTVAKYNSTGDYLTDALANLPGSYSPDD